MISLLILDVEGVITLPGGSQVPWPLDDMLALRAALQHAPYASVLCTGRQEPYGEAVCQALDLFRPLPHEIRERAKEFFGVELLGWPSVLENGAYFYDAPAKRAIPHPELTDGRVGVLQKLKTDILAPLVNQTRAQFEPGKDFCISINPPLRNPETGEREATDGFRQVVDVAVRGYTELIEVHHSASAIDITPKGVSKASAVRRLLEWTGLKPEEVLGVGDSKADELWLQEVGWRAAPANGRMALRGLDYYSAQAVTRGLLDILEQLKASAYQQLTQAEPPALPLHQRHV